MEPATPPQINATLRKETPAQFERNKARLRRLLALESNSVCADCPIEIGQDREQQWASINLGIFVCLPCSGIHRNLGVHITKVKSVQLDDWNTEWVDNMEKWGNERSNREVWEVGVPPTRSRPTEREAQAYSTQPGAGQKLERWIRDKYERKQFTAARGESSRTEEGVTVHRKIFHVGASMKRLNKMFTADMVAKNRAGSDGKIWSDCWDSRAQRTVQHLARHRQNHRRNRRST